MSQRSRNEAGRAQSRSPEARRQDGRQQKQKKQKKPRREIPFALGIAGMVLVLALSVFVGNARTLGKAEKRLMRRWDAQETVLERAECAYNLKTIGARYDSVSAEELSAMEDVARRLEKSADSPRAVSRLSGELQGTMSNLCARLMSGGMTKEDERLLSGVMDDFADSGNILRQAARRFNEEAKETRELYGSLPARFLLPEPEYYEGL